jgi:hypothetical protein
MDVVWNYIRNSQGVSSNKIEGNREEHRYNASIAREVFKIENEAFGC